MNHKWRIVTQNRVVFLIRYGGYFYNPLQNKLYTDEKDVDFSDRVYRSNPF